MAKDDNCAGPGDSPGTECTLPVEKSGLCAGHRKQRVRGERLKPLRRYDTVFVRLQAAALALADAQELDAYERAADRLEKAAEAYARRQRVRRRRPQDVVPPRPDARRRGQESAQR